MPRAQLQIQVGIGFVVFKCPSPRKVMPNSTVIHMKAMHFAAQVVAQRHGGQWSGSSQRSAAGPY